MGRVPRDLELDYEKWEDVPSPLVEQRKEMFAISCISSLLCDYDVVNAEVIVKSLIAYAVNTTSNTRKFMEEHPGQNQQNDHEKYPGKMDHTTAVAFVVGSNDHPSASMSCPATAPASPVLYSSSTSSVPEREGNNETNTDDDNGKDVKEEKIHKHRHKH